MSATPLPGWLPGFLTGLQFAFAPKTNRLARKLPGEAMAVFETP
jgi:hypothetical protein